MKNFKWDKKYLYWGVTAFLVVVASIAFFWVLNTWSGLTKGLSTLMGVLAPVTYGVLIAYLLNRVLVTFENGIFRPLAAKVFPRRPVTARKTARILSILLTMTLTIGFIVGLLMIVLPEITRSIVDLVNQSQHYADVVVRWLEKVLNGEALEPVVVNWINSISDNIVGWLETNVLPRITAMLTSITDGVISVVGTIVNLLLGLVISVYVMYNKETFCAQAKKLLYSAFKPRTVHNLLSELGFIDDAFGNYIIGTLIDALIVGVANYIFMAIMGMPYVALISIIVGVTNIIPMFGPFIGAVPSGLLLVLESPTQCLFFLIFTVVLQQIDGQILKPRIHSSRTGLSGFWITFAIIFFGGLFGIMGMIVGVPITTVLYSLFRRLNNKRLRRRGLPEGTDFYMDIESIDPETGEPIYKPGRGPEEPEETAPAHAVEAEEESHEDTGD